MEEIKIGDIIEIIDVSELSSTYTDKIKLGEKYPVKHVSKEGVILNGVFFGKNIFKEEMGLLRKRVKLVI